MLNLRKCALTAMLLSLVSLAAVADAPRWVRKGVKTLNSQKTNDTYDFVSLNTHDVDLSLLKEHAPDALKTYVEEIYSPVYTSIKVNELPSQGGFKEYEVEYQSLEGVDYSIRARLVDVYEEFDDFEENSYQYEYYQLYAVSKPNIIPMYDNFHLTTNYNTKAVVSSLVPGMGQLDKGQTTKGYVILGSEIALVGATVYFDYMRRDSKKMMKDDQGFVDSWNSKRQAWLNFEYISAGAAIGLYIYNLIDAAVSKGARQVEVKPRATSYQLTPYAAPDHMGVQFVLNF